MALTLEQLQTKREEIVKSMGVQMVQLPDRMVRFPTQPEMTAALQQIDAEIAKMSSPAERVFVVRTSRGL